MVSQVQDQGNPKQHPIWAKKELDNVTENHVSPNNGIDYLAFALVQGIQFIAELTSGHGIGFTSERKAMRLGLFLETIAVVPGIVATIVRYAKDFLGIDHDKDWLYTTIQESQVERIHLLSWMELYNPNVIVRMLILGMQTMVFWMVMLCYILSPSFCHRFVGYLEELTLEKYTDLVAEVDDSRLSTWATQEAPLVAKDYWKMKDDANIRDMLLELRADEARHRDINHTFASIATKQNPFLEHPKASWISI